MLDTRYVLECNSSFLLLKERSHWFKAARFVRPEFVLLVQNDSVLSFSCSANDLDMRTSILSFLEDFYSNGVVYEASDHVVAL